MKLCSFAFALSALALPTLAQAGVKETTATVLTWQVLPDPTAVNGGTLWCYNHVTNEVTSYELDIPNGWGNLPSERVVTQYTVSQSGVLEDPPTAKFRTEWVCNNNMKWSVETPVTGGDSPENHARLLKQHEKDVAELAKRHPPRPEPVK